MIEKLTGGLLLSASVALTAVAGHLAVVQIELVAHQWADHISAYLSW